MIRWTQNKCSKKIRGGQNPMLIQANLSIEEKLRILSDAAKYDAACTSSGVGRKGKEGFLGNSRVDGICHSFASDGRCISLLKILFTNQCIYDCHYCVNRRSNDTVRTSFTPEEVCRLTMEFYRRNYIEGLFLSSGVLDTPDHTMELLYQTLYRLRRVHRFNGYIHVKAIPGADPALIERVGFLADRMSVNLELPTADGLRRLAPGKTRDKILRPMRQIQTGIARQLDQEGCLESRGAWIPPKSHGEIQIPGAERQEIKDGTIGEEWGKSNDDLKRASMINAPGRMEERPGKMPMPEIPRVIPGRSIYGSFGLGNISNRKNYFVPGGQSTQLIVGATPESDYQMVTVAEALYRNFGLKRVFYSAFIKVNEDSILPDLPDGPPLLREHRLYQADWLMRYYGFRASELLSEKHPNFNVFLDPKCDWALQNLGEFPVEVNQAPYETLLRVPGVGVKSAIRIVAARKQTALRFEDLKKMGVVLKRAVYFITCSGRMMYPVRIHEDALAAQLVSEEKRKQWQLSQSGLYRQMSLFDDFHMAQA